MEPNLATLDERGLAPPKGFKRHEYVVNGVKTVVHIGGTGRPVVYWHGAGAWHGIDFARPWTERFKVIAPFHPGWGESGDAPQLEGLQEYLLHYLDLFDQLNLAQFDLIGFSLGGLMAAQFALAHTHRVRKLVLVAPAGLNDSDEPGPAIGRWTREEMYAHLVSDVQLLEPYLPASPEAAARHVAVLAREAASAARLAAQGADYPRLERWLHRITMPTLLVWSTEDRIAPYARAARWMERLPNAKLATFEGAGHLVLDELAPARARIAKFLA